MRTFFNYIVFGLLLGTASLRLFAAEPLVVAAVEYAPYTSSKMDNDGYVNHIVKLAFESKGIPTTFEYLPWARAVKEGEEGQYEAVSYALFVEERTKHFLYSNPIINEEFHFFTRRDTAIESFNGLSSIEGLRLGLTRGYAYPEEVWQYANQKSDTVSIVNSDLQNFRMLALKRIDVFPINRLVGRRIIKESFENNQNYFRVLTPSLMVRPTHLLISKQSPRANELISLFNDALSEMQQNGELNQIKDEMMRVHYPSD